MLTTVRQKRRQKTQLWGLYKTQDGSVYCGALAPVVGREYYVCGDMARLRVSGICHRSGLTQSPRRVCVIGTKQRHVPPRALNRVARMGSNDLAAFINHSGRGSSNLSLAHMVRVDEIGGTPSVEFKSDRHDNALADSQVAPFKTDLIKNRHPWRALEQVELATLEWVWRFNYGRLPSEIGNMTPIEPEQAYDADKDPLLGTVRHGKTSEKNPVRFSSEKFLDIHVCLFDSCVCPHERWVVAVLHYPYVRNQVSNM